MRATAWLRRRSVEVGWAVFALANLAAMALWETWETVPFHFIWVSLTLVYGFRIWRLGATLWTLAGVFIATGTLILADVQGGSQLAGELFEVPLMSAMFLAMVWHARRRQQALGAMERLADERASLLERQERFLHDASHELRTPVTIARGHLEMLQRLRNGVPEVDVALDELERIERIVERLLLLAKADQPDFLMREEIDIAQFLEDVFLRWCEVAPRAWRLGPLPSGTFTADPEAVRNALDALLENAVKYTEAPDAIELRAKAGGGQLAIAVADEGFEIPADAMARIFDRFARADPARTRAQGGVGLGLAIVDTIAKAHGGRCTVSTSEGGTTFTLFLPSFRPSPMPARAAVRSSVST
jgi:signal transduction histidine kinase